MTHKPESARHGIKTADKAEEADASLDFDPLQQVLASLC